MHAYKVAILGPFNSADTFASAVPVLLNISLTLPGSPMAKIVNPGVLPTTVAIAFATIRYPAFRLSIIVLGWLDCSFSIT